MRWPRSPLGCLAITAPPEVEVWRAKSRIAQNRSDNVVETTRRAYVCEGRSPASRHPWRRGPGHGQQRCRFLRALEGSVGWQMRLLASEGIRARVTHSLSSRALVEQHAGTTFMRAQ